MNSFKERSWNPKYELGHQSKRNPLTRRLRPRKKNRLENV
jgi:hypothetical protein